MASTKVKEYFEKIGISDRIKTFNTSTATVELAAQALNCKKEHIAKTISFIVNNEPILIVIAGDMKANNSKFTSEFGEKMKMLTHEQTKEKIGHEVGGVCPFAVNDGVKIYLDISLKRFSHVYPACGSANSGIQLSIEELEQFSNYEKWVDIAVEI